MAAEPASEKHSSPAKATAAAQDAPPLTAKALSPSRPTLYAILLAAFALRIAIFAYTDVSAQLQSRPELSTPVNSWGSLLEAHYLHRNPPTSSAARHARRPHLEHVSAYHSGTIHHSPLLLPLLSNALSRHLSDPRDLVAPLLWSLADVAAGYFVFRICLTRETAALVRKTHLWPWDRSRANRAALIYLFNPYTLGVCLARSTAAIENLAILASVYAAMTASALLMSVSWAFASLLSLYPALLLPLLCQLCVKRAGEAEYESEISHFAQKTEGSLDVKRARRLGFLVDRMRKAKRWALVKLLVLCPAILVAGVVASRAIALNPGSKLPFLEAVVESLARPWEEGWEWAERVYGVILLVTDLTPNLGLWWYFFIETFDHFRTFFLLTFNVHVAAYVVPVLIKYRQDPLFGLTVMLGIIAVFKSYPTVGDHALFLSLFSLHSQIFEYLRYPLVSTLLYAYCTLLSPAFHHLWLVAGSGNANFFYAITLVWALGGGMLLLDMIWAWGRDRWERERPPIRSKKADRIAATAESDADAGAALTDDGKGSSVDRASAEVTALKEAASARRRVVVQI
ncbi:uncharacterized protein PFL1_00492 [Pseudozyma flocculosa PF-1]|uniref:Related to GPI - transamidase subunit n=1 Tax=Pseudozyma flocculosa TaxID=84751 RepID=A0A5C3ERA9_9BASI|nr:uncharacterized protein PFL1_00492 [Pseudozyma flocculosa PF-1]EPQ32296.1 hypothetical protein PFL1_00492 [Pseudozyma flocculosa PF-1]SPO34748.1 related to GPI - transamidase subunit [Pseudozyma flocculosa]